MRSQDLSLGRDPSELNLTRLSETQTNVGLRVGSADTFLGPQPFSSPILLRLQAFAQNPGPAVSQARRLLQIF